MSKKVAELGFLNRSISRRGALIGAGVVAASPLFSHILGAEAAAADFKKKTPIKIGYSVYDLKQSYWESYLQGVQAECKAEGYGFVSSDQKSSEAAEVSGSINLINQGISALIVSPVQPAALPAVVTAAHKAQIPVIIGDVGGGTTPYDAFVLSDNYGGGKLAAQYMVKKLGSKPGTKEVAILLLHPGNAVGIPRSQGFLDEMKKHPDFKVVAKLNANDEVDKGYTVTKDILSAHPNVAGIYACNDPEAEGAQQALKTAGKSGVTDVLLVGFNGDPPALQLIKSGAMAATIRQDPFGQGRTCVKLATSLMNGKALSFSDPKAKAVFFSVNLVDASNVGTYLK
jgi:ribose transport system substrate-binding protein